ATTRASAARSFLLAISPSCLRNASKLGSFTDGGSVMATGLEGPTAGARACAGAWAGAWAGGCAWAKADTGASAPAITSAAATRWVEERRGCRIAILPRFRALRLAPDLARSTARKKGLRPDSRARAVRWRDCGQRPLGPRRGPPGARHH